mmetsp:Transcript_50340/g.129796  ORF Transcript_50340/g.129796 Transcript_50340/m.129796 type:complete len:319 (-) Transcript_50340:948-1904(-)
MDGKTSQFSRAAVWAKLFRHHRCSSRLRRPGAAAATDVARRRGKRRRRRPPRRVVSRRIALRWRRVASRRVTSRCVQRRRKGQPTCGCVVAAALMASLARAKVRCSPAMSIFARCSWYLTLVILSVAPSMSPSIFPRDISRILSSRRRINMSLAFASPLRRFMPPTNSSGDRDPSPSSRISQSSSRSLGKMSMARNFCRTFRFFMDIIISSLVIVPEPSSSICWKMKVNSSSSLARFSLNFTSSSDSSIFESEKAFSTITAVIKFINTNWEIVMKIMKKKPIQICCPSIRRLQRSPHESRVMIWKSVNMDLGTSPKFS